MKRGRPIDHPIKKRLALIERIRREIFQAEPMTDEDLAEKCRELGLWEDGQEDLAWEAFKRECLSILPADCTAWEALEGHSS